jgi:hypothetical protein
VRAVPIALAGLAAIGCAAVLAAPSPAAFDPASYFLGRTRGDAVLHKMFGKPVRIVVESVGRKAANNQLVLDQVVHEDGKAPDRRRWVLRRVAPNRYTGTMTAAEGPVEVEVEGMRASIRYRMKGKLKVEQQLMLQSDRKTVINRMTVKKLGVRVAQLDETIRKLD